MRLKKNILICAFALLLAVAVFWIAFMPPVTGSDTLLIDQIQAHQESLGTEGRIDLTPVVEPHLRAGMTRLEVEEFFGKMGFENHQSWKDKNTLIADYRSPFGPPGLNIMRIYRFRLRFDKEILVDFDGITYTEAP
jgi:hypothetical protein